LTDQYDSESGLAIRSFPLTMAPARLIRKLGLNLAGELISNLAGVL